METNIQSVEDSAEEEPDSIRIEALRRARVAEFMADLDVAGASRYIPVPGALMDYDQSYRAVHQAA